MGFKSSYRIRPAFMGSLNVWVAAERECCAFMTISVDTTDRELLVLTVTAPELPAPILDQMLAGGGRDI